MGVSKRVTNLEHGALAVCFDKQPTAEDGRVSRVGGIHRAFLASRLGVIVGLWLFFGAGM